MSAGNKGNVRIYITHPLVGEITIPETTIMNLYLSKTPGSSGDNIPLPFHRWRTSPCPNYYRAAVLFHQRRAGY